MQRLTVRTDDLPGEYDGDVIVLIDVGMDRTRWISVMPHGAVEIDDQTFLSIAEKLDNFLLDARDDIRWFRYHPPAGMLGHEIECVIPSNNDGTEGYDQLRKKPVTAMQYLWLQIMGFCPGLEPQTLSPAN